MELQDTLKDSYYFIADNCSALAFQTHVTLFWGKKPSSPNKDFLSKKDEILKRKEI